ncbi:hypothetical protein GCM10027184_12080 [Saccharothrix stipae]
MSTTGEMGQATSGSPDPLVPPVTPSPFHRYFPLGTYYIDETNVPGARET